MKRDNVLFKVSKLISCNLEMDEIEQLLTELLSTTETIYSYIVYIKYENDLLLGWLLEYMLSQTDENNTLKSSDVVSEILEIISKHRRSDKTKVIGYRQPNLDLIIKLLDPLVKKLASYENRKWRQFEYDDLCQMCRLVITELYNKGYYIHKSVVQKSFENYVLMQLRPERNKPAIVSIDDILCTGKGDDMEKVRLVDTIADDYEEQEKESFDNEVTMKIFEEVKDIIIDLVGERRFDQLFRDYSNRHTTTQTRKMMNKIKDYFITIGITMEDFINKYYG